MAHFAELDSKNTVTRVVVISNEDIKDSDGIEQESIGIEVCNSLFGPGLNWIQTSYNSTFRKTYGRVGYIYDETKDLFYDPVSPYPSWVLDTNMDWQSPVPKPDNASTLCFWDEDSLSWVDPVDLPM